MYSQVRYFIKAGIGFLMAGLLIGLYMVVAREMFDIWPHPMIRSAHAHAVGSGFIMFLILGVALWLFPRAAKGDTRYRPERIALAFWVLLLSTATRIGGEVARAWIDAPLLRWTVAVAGAAQLIGFGIYFWTMWTRIRPVGSHLREAKGERF